MGKSTNGCMDHIRNFDPVIKENNTVLTFWYFIPKGSTIGQIHVVLYCSTMTGGRVTKVLIPEKTNEWVKVSLNFVGEISPELLGADIAGMEINGLGKDTFLIDDVQIENLPSETLRLVKLKASAKASAGGSVEIAPTFTSDKPISKGGVVGIWLSLADPDEKIQFGKTIFSPSPSFTEFKPGQENAIGPVKINIPEYVRPGKYDICLKIAGVNLIHDASTQVNITAKSRPKKVIPSFLLEKADMPAEASLGNKVQISCMFNQSDIKTGKMFVQMKQEKVLVLVYDQPVQNQIAFDLPADIPTGEYEVYAGIYGNPSRLAGKILVGDPKKIQKKVLRRSLGYGTYIDDQDVPHHWYINQANTMIWDGEPYLPVGGMFESHFRAYIPNEDNWRQDVEALQLIRSKGIRDTYVNPPGRFRGQWNWQPLVDKLEELDFRYGLELSAIEPRYMPCDAYVVRMYEELNQADKGRKIIKSGNFMIDDIRNSGHYRLGKPVEFGSMNTKVLRVNHVLYGLFDTTESTMAKTGWADFTFSNNQLNIEVDLLVPREGHTYTVYFVPKITFHGPFANFWKGYDLYSRTLPAELKKIHFGKNLRFFVDPTDNEPGIYDEHAEFMFYFNEYQDQYGRWLEKKYKNIGVLNTQWAVKKEKPLPDFGTAADLVPLQVGPKGSNWQNRAFLLHPPTRQIYEIDYSRTLLWYDSLDFRYESYMEYHNQFSDEIKKAVNVPVIYKRAYLDTKYAINTWKNGGSDGIGNENYGYGERLTYIAMEGFGKCMDSARTMWSLTTETHHEGGMNFGYTGYKSEDDMIDTFGRQMIAGSKGIFHFLLHTSVGWNNHALVNDPKQLDWMKRFADAVEKRKDFIANYLPPVNWSFPPEGMCWVMPNDRNCFLRDDYNGGGYSVKSASGVWFTPTFYPIKYEGGLVMVNLENTPATILYGSVFEQMLKDSNRKFIYVGLRRNLGRLSIDRYFTSKITPLGSDQIQVLKPSPTSKILYKTEAGDVWGLEDGNLQIVSRTNAYENLGGDPRVKYIQVRGSNLPTVQFFLQGD